MAVEPRRGCGYRKVGGLYLCGEGAGAPCDRLPYPLTICPCCSHGIKQTRGWTWLDVHALTGGVHVNCHDTFGCPFCTATESMGRVGLLWIGEKFYPKLSDFRREANSIGISRRITAPPRGFKVGETWVLLAHPVACVCEACAGSGLTGESNDLKPCEACKKTGKLAGIFHIFRPTKFEKIITQSQSEDAEWMQKEIHDRGFTAVVVPDDDPDHRGTVYEDEEQETNGEINGK